MTRIAAALAPVLAQIRANPRLQVGVAVIAMILVWWLHGALSAWATSQSGRRADAELQLARMTALIGETEWASRASSAASLRDALLAEIEPAQTRGLAQANLQTTAMRWMRAAGLADRLRVQVEAPRPTDVPGVTAITMTLSGEVSPGEVVALLREAESQRALVVVEDLRYSPAVRGIVNLRVRAFYRIAEASGEASP